MSSGPVRPARRVPSPQLARGLAFHPRSSMRCGVIAPRGRLEDRVPTQTLVGVADPLSATNFSPDGLFQASRASSQHRRPRDSFFVVQDPFPPPLLSPTIGPLLFHGGASTLSHPVTGGSLRARSRLGEAQRIGGTQQRLCAKTFYGGVSTPPQKSARQLVAQLGRVHLPRISLGTYHTLNNDMSNLQEPPLAFGVFTESSG